TSAAAPRRLTSLLRDRLRFAVACGGRQPLGVRIRIADVAARGCLCATLQGAVAWLAEEPVRLFPRVPRLAGAARARAWPGSRRGLSGGGLRSRRGAARTDDSLPPRSRASDRGLP